MPEDLDEIKNWAERNFEAVKKRVDTVQQEMRNNKPRENINVRKVSTEEGPKIVVEHTVQRWYSPEYFRKMLEDDNSRKNSEQEEDTIF